MPLIRSVAQFQLASSLPEDVIQNTWHFYMPVGPIESADMAEIGAALNAFYTVNLDSWMSPLGFAAGLPRVDHYEVGPGGVTGAPIGFSELIGWNPVSPANPMPS